MEQFLTYLRGETAMTLLKSVASVLLFTGAAVFLFWILKRFFPRLYKLVHSWEGTVITGIRFRSKEIIGAETVTSAILTILQGIRFGLTLFIVYFTLILSVNAIPWSNGFDFHLLLNSIISTLFILVIMRFLLTAVFSFHAYSKAKIEAWNGSSIRSVAISNIELLSADRISSILLTANTIVRLAGVIIVVYLTTTSIFSLYEFTREWSALLLHYIVNPLTGILSTMIGYLPNLITITVIGIVTRYAIKFVHLIFSEIEKENFVLPGFYAEWADPTFKIVRFLIIVFAAVIIFPYLPGSDSDAFKGISVFLGILFSFGSSSAISNVVSGIVLTYMRPFRIGDRVKIADTMGDVIEKTLLVTRVRTIKNVDVTVPNSMVLGSHIVNFSAQARDKGLILHTTITIGYDAPWTKVHELLIAAAKKTDHILGEPAPFVLQTALNDFYVSYELNAYTDSPTLMAKIYSDIHQHIQDSFNEGGIEIMSPHYSSLRDGNQSTIPTDYLPKDYQARGFKIFPAGEKK